MIRVWDPFVRAFHWALALSFAVAWLSAEHLGRLHEAAGYVAGALIAARIVWVRRPSLRGVLPVRALSDDGPRLSQGDRRGLGAAVRRPQSGRRGDDRRPHGRDGGGGRTGWLLTTDAFWGSIGAQHVHSIVAHGVILLVLAHLAGIALASLRHRETLVRAMVVGAKRAAEPGDVM